MTAGALWRFWQLTGALREAAGWFESLLDDDSASATAGRAKALRGAGGIAYWQNDLPRSRQLYEASVAQYKQLGDRAGTAAALNDLAYLPLLMGEPEVAEQLFSQARDMFLELNDDWQATLAELNLAGALFFLHRLDDAGAAMESVLPALRDRGDRFWLTEAVTGLGQLGLMRGDLGSARRYFAESLQLALQADTMPQVAMVLEPMSNVDSAQGDHPRAVQLWAAAQAIKERIGGGAPPEMMQTVDPRSAATDAIGADAVERAWAEGYALSPADAVALAVSPPALTAASSSKSNERSRMRHGQVVD